MGSCLLILPSGFFVERIKIALKNLDLESIFSIGDICRELKVQQMMRLRKTCKHPTWLTNQPATGRGRWSISGVFPTKDHCICSIFVSKHSLLTTDWFRLDCRVCFLDGFRGTDWNWGVSVDIFFEVIQFVLIHTGSLWPQQLSLSKQKRRSTL